VTDTEAERLAAYAVPLVGTVAGTPAGAVAGRALADAEAVAAAHAAEAPADEAERRAWRLAIVRTECLRQLRARGAFADEAADVWVAAETADDDAALVAAAFLGLPPRQRDLLALGWVSDLPVAGLARVSASGSPEGYATRLSAARDALATAAGATALAVRPTSCDGLAVELLPRTDGGEPADVLDEDEGKGEDEGGPQDDSPRPLSPAVRARVSDHSRRCPRCGARRQEFLAAALPGFRLPAARPVPEALPAAAGALDPVARFGEWDPDGFPTPPDAVDASPRRWLRLAVAAAAVSAALLLLGTLALLTSNR
jgi:DNA-directed RNA polymerase specialized sigma24 family protein